MRITTNDMRDQLKENSESNRAKDNRISTHVESIVSTTTDAKKSPLISCGGLACMHIFGVLTKFLPEQDLNQMAKCPSNRECRDTE